MRAAICVRVSPRPQDRVRYSPEIQESKCREWCLQNGHEVVTVIQDILVSGGSESRFDSIFAALDAHDIELFVVSDLSRWTRDRPSRFWAIKAILEDRGVQLASVDDPYLNTDMPFADTVTTARVEAFYQERVVLRRKTSEGVLRAVAAGKVMGKPRLGWSRDAQGWAQDVPLIRSFYEAWIAGTSATEMSRRFGIPPGSVRRAIEAQAQRRIVGDDVWLRAQARPKGLRFKARSDAQTPNIFRGLLHCPFCSAALQRSRGWHYYCKWPVWRQIPHDWRFLSARRHVLPAVRAGLATLYMPDSEAAALDAPREPAPSPRDLAGERDRLTMAWVKGNISQPRYDKALAELREAEAAVAAPPPPIEERVEMVRTLSFLEFEGIDPEEGALLNRLLREVLTITVNPDRSATVEINPAYQHWQLRSTA